MELIKIFYRFLFLSLSTTLFSLRCAAAVSPIAAQNASKENAKTNSGTGRSDVKCQLSIFASQFLIKIFLGTSETARHSVRELSLLDGRRNRDNQDDDDLAWLSLSHLVDDLKPADPSEGATRIQITITDRLFSSSSARLRLFLLATADVSRRAI
jgi:hypothetical protein